MVFEVISQERNYQEFIIEKDPNRCEQTEIPHSVGDYLTMLATYLRKAQDAWTNHGGVQGSLHEIRKIGAIAVHCMEDHGAPPRINEA